MTVTAANSRQEDRPAVRAAIVSRSPALYACAQSTKSNARGLARRSGGEMSHPFGILSQFGRKFSGVIHVGANNGKEVVEYNKYMIKHAVLIEPLPNVFDQLKKSIIGYDGFTAVQALCSHLPNINYDFYIANNNGQSSSLLKPKRHVVEHPDVEFNSKMEIL